jgi:hypothetical protein
MPDEYTALVEALQNTNISFAEYGWKTRPEGAYGVVALDMEAGSLAGSDGKRDRAFEVKVDVFFRKLSDRADIAGTVEDALTNCLGASWELNSIQYETETGLFHFEWIGQVTGTITAPEQDPPAAEAQDGEG